MRLIKLALLSVFFLLLVVTIIGLLFPSNVRISKAIDISHAKDSVRHMLVDTTTWRSWHPTFMAGSKFLSRNAATYTPGANTDSLVRMTVDYGKRTVEYGWQFHNYPGSENYTLQWWADFELGWYPWERMGSLFYEKTYGAMMEQGLKNLDSVLKVREDEALK
jgi:hypothetical protein